MANKIEKDSHLPVFVKQIKVAEANVSAANVPKVNDFVKSGAKYGLVGATPKLGQLGWFTTVDTAATIRLSGVTGTFADGASVFVLSDGTYDDTTATGAVKIGYADRRKTDAAAGDLWVQLVPSAG